jgi:hypothetical protein
MLLNKFIRRGYEQLKQQVGVMELRQSRVACFGICGLFQAVVTQPHIEQGLSEDTACGRDIDRGTVPYTCVSQWSIGLNPTCP